MLTSRQIDATADWIAAHQAASGEIPWWRNGKMDPWDHIHAAMGLTVAGRMREAMRAYAFLARTQTELGGWYAWREAGKTTDRTQETNHAAYVATGVWQLYLAAKDPGFLADTWPMVERAIDFVCSMQEPNGTISWAVDPSGKSWRAPLLTGSSSTHGSLVCALRIADTLGYERPRWDVARERLVRVLRERPELFDRPDLPDRVGRYSMDWYYPILGGAVRGTVARDRLSSRDFHERFLTEGVGCRCVDDVPWYTVAETCELVLALDACGLTSRAQQVHSWSRHYRMEDGGYRTGKTHPEGVFWPLEHNAWTAASVIIANDALAKTSATSGLFRSLSGEDLPVGACAIASGGLRAS